MLKVVLPRKAEIEKRQKELSFFSINSAQIFDYLIMYNLTLVKIKTKASMNMEIYA